VFAKYTVQSLAPIHQILNFLEEDVKIVHEFHILLQLMGDFVPILLVISLGDFRTQTHWPGPTT